MSVIVSTFAEKINYMGIFDCLIDKDNNCSPKADMEYIYLMDMVWRPNKLGDEPIKYGTIVTNVIRLDNGSYEFTCKETNDVFSTNYAWALAENTPDNVKKVVKYEWAYKKFKEYKKLVDDLRNNIVTLKLNI